MFTPSEAIEAMKARINGEWDNPQLLKVGDLRTDSFEDIKYIIELTDQSKPDYRRNHHILIIKDKHATNHLPAMVQIISERRKESVTISYSNEPGAANGLLDTAVKYLTDRGFVIVGRGDGKHELRNVSDYLISTTFDKSIK